VKSVDSTHYVAHIRLTRVDQGTKEKPTGGKDSYNRPAMAEVEHRAVTELGNVTVKGNDLESLKSKVNAHVALIEDIEVVDEVREGQRRVNDV
jgi:hypothetical protein